VLVAESLAAVTGLWPKRPPTPGDLKATARFAKQIETAISNFVDGKQAKFAWTTAPDSNDLHDQIVAIIDPDEAAEWMTAIGEDPEAGLDYLAIIKAGRDYLLSIWPSITIPVTGAPLIPLSRDDLDAVWSVFRVLADPMTILTEVGAWTLTRAQSMALKTVFPSVYADIDSAIEEAMLSKIADGGYLTPEVEDVMRVWRLKPLDSPIKIESVASDKPQAQSAPGEKMNTNELKAPSEFNAGERVGS
jgi:hypothetical protein